MTDNTMRYIGFRGVSGGQLDGRHAEIADNVYIDDNCVRKRKGYRQTARFEGRINGVWSVRVGSMQGVLVYAGTRFYLREQGAEDKTENYTDITSSATACGVDTSRLADRRISVFQHDDRVYIVGCGDYLVLKSVGDHPELRRVEDEEDTYVPTTTVGIGCDCAVHYVQATVDDDTVGNFYVRQGDDYVVASLDGDENLPEEGVVYYRRLTTEREGTTLESPNMLSSYRVNTLYGTDADSAVYHLDTPHVDPDSHTVVELDVEEEGSTTHHVLTPQTTGNELRAVLVGDDLSGKELQVGHTTLGNVDRLRTGSSTKGMFELVATGGSMRWECSGDSMTAWNRCRLVLRTAFTTAVVAEATRSSILGRYTVTWSAAQFDLPADLGVVRFVGTTFLASSVQAQLPVLRTDLAEGNTVWAELDYRQATITFSRATTPPGLEDNVRVLFKCRSAEFDAERVNTTTLGVLYGVAGNADRLFVGASDDLPTTDYHSESDDWTYFAPSGRTELGKAGRIAAYVAVGDDLLTMLADCGATVNVYYRTGTWTTDGTQVGEDYYSLRTAVFGITKTATLPTAACRYCSCVVGSDVVYLAEDGLYRLVRYALTDDAKTHRLSGPVDEVRWSENSAVIAHDKRVLISDGGRVYVADSRYRVGVEGTSHYEWTTWSIGGVREWCVVEGNLCFGTEEGRLCAFGDGWEDVVYTDAAVGQVSVQPEDNVLAYDEELCLAEGDEIHLGRSVYATLCTPLEVDGDCVYVDSDSVLHLYEGTVVYPVVESTLGSPLRVADVDWGRCCFRLIDAQGDPYDVPAGLEALVLDLSQRTVLCHAPNGGVAELRYADGTRVDLYHGLLPTALTARLVRRTPVKAVYASVPHPFNTPDIAKILVGVTVEMESNCRAEAQLSVRTSLAGERRRVLGLNELDYDWLDMGAFAFDGDFPRSYTVRLKLRFHYVQWRVESSTAGEMALRGVCLRYRYLRPAKGVGD